MDAEVYVIVAVSNMEILQSKCPDCSAVSCSVEHNSKKPGGLHLDAFTT